MESINASADFVCVELTAGDSCGMQARRATSIVFPHERDCQTIPGPEPKSPSPCSPLELRQKISGARFHRVRHVSSVLHVRKTTVISAPVLSRLPSGSTFCTSCRCRRGRDRCDRLWSLLCEWSRQERDHSLRTDPADVLARTAASGEMIQGLLRIQSHLPH